MTPRKKVPFFTKLDPELRQALRDYKIAVGVPEAEQVDRALREWLGERADAWPLVSPKVEALLAQSGKTYVRKLPAVVPAGRVLVHNSVGPTRRLGSRGFRTWL